MKKLYDEEEVIEVLSDWVKKHPKLDLNYGFTTSFNDADDSLKEEYQEVLKKYNWLDSRRRLGKLSDEQLKRCKEANLGGKFGFSEKIEKISKMYDCVMYYVYAIISEYGSIENLYDAFVSGKKVDYNVNLFLTKYHDVDMIMNPKYLRLVEALGFYNNGDLVCYSKKGIDEALSTLDVREKKVIEMYFGLINDKSFYFEEIGNEFNISRTRVMQIVEKALRKLRQPSRNKKFIVNFDLKSLNENELNEFKNAEKVLRISRNQEEIIKANEIIKKYIAVDKAKNNNCSNTDAESTIKDDSAGKEEILDVSSEKTDVSIDEIKSENDKLKENIEDKKRKSELLEKLISLACEHDRLKSQEAKLDKEIAEKLAILNELGFKYEKNNK